MPDKLIQNGTTAAGITYYIYEDTDGSVYVETLCNRHYTIADSLDEFYKISFFKLEDMIYRAEMNVAR